MAKRHICDVPGCGAHRQRWQRLCQRCWEGLPGDIRTGITATHKQGRKGAKRALCARAAAHLGIAAPAPALPTAPRISAQDAFERNQRLLGER